MLSILSIRLLLIMRWALQLFPFFHSTKAVSTQCHRTCCVKCLHMPNSNIWKCDIGEHFLDCIVSKFKHWFHGFVAVCIAVWNAKNVCWLGWSLISPLWQR